MTEKEAFELGWRLIPFVWRDMFGDEAQTWFWQRVNQDCLDWKFNGMGFATQGGALEAFAESVRLEKQFVS